MLSCSEGRIPDNPISFFELTFVGTAICLPTAHTVEALAQHFHAALLQRLLCSTLSLLSYLLLPAKKLVHWHVPLHHWFECQNDAPVTPASNWNPRRAIIRGSRSYHTGFDHYAGFGKDSLSYGHGFHINGYRWATDIRSAKGHLRTLQELSSLHVNSFTNGLSTGGLWTRKPSSPSPLR